MRKLYPLFFPFTINHSALAQETCGNSLNDNSDKLIYHFDSECQQSKVELSTRTHDSKY